MELKEPGFAKALALSMRYLTARERTVRELQTYLTSKMLKYGFTQEDAQAAIKAVVERGYLNEERYVEAMTRYQSDIKGKSWRIIAQKLKEKGIQSEQIQAVAEEAQKKDADIIQKYLPKLQRKYDGLKEWDKRQKITASLARKGFSLSTIKQALEASS